MTICRGFAARRRRRERGEKRLFLSLGKPVGTGVLDCPKVGAATCCPHLPEYGYTDNRKESFVPFFRKKGTPKTAKRRWAYAPSLGTHPQIDLTANPCFLSLALWYLTDRAFAGGRQCLCGYHATSDRQNRSLIVGTGVPDCPQKRKTLQKTSL